MSMTVRDVPIAPMCSFIICQSRRFPWINILHFVYSLNKGEACLNQHFTSWIKYDRSAPEVGQKFLNFNSQPLCFHDAFSVNKVRESGKTEEAMDAWFGSLYLPPGDYVDHLTPD